MPRRIGIIGANGFVGRHVALEARVRGVEVIGVVRSEEAARVVARFGAAPVLLQSLEPETVPALAEAFAGCGAVVYTASVAARVGAADRTDPQGLLNVITAAEAAGVGRILFFSGLGVSRYGLSEHCTNPYFLAKLSGEVALFRSGLAGVVFRPSYIFGAPGEQFLGPLMRRMLTDPEIEIPGAGSYRMQPISVQDTARAVLSAIDSSDQRLTVFDLVGPDVVSYRSLIERAFAGLGKSLPIRERPLAEALLAAKTSSYFGLRSHDLACLLCDEVSDSRPIVTLIGQPLETLETMVSRGVEALRAEGALP